MNTTQKCKPYRDTEISAEIEPVIYTPTPPKYRLGKPDKVLMPESPSWTTHAHGLFRAVRVAMLMVIFMLGMAMLSLAVLVSK